MEDTELETQKSSSLSGCNITFYTVGAYLGLWFLGAFFYTCLVWAYFSMNVNSPLDNAGNGALVVQYGIILLLVSAIPLLLASIVNTVVALCIGLTIGKSEDNKSLTSILIGLSTGIIVWVAMENVMNMFNDGLQLSTFRDLSWLAFPTWLVFLYAIVMAVVRFAFCNID